MPPRGCKKQFKPPARLSSEEGSSDQMAKKRFGFNVEKDVKLLTLALANNPWGLGDSMWKNIVDEMSRTYKAKVGTRTCQDRVTLLIEKYQKQELTTKTGTEEQRTERADLIMQLIALKEEESAAIIIQHGADDDSPFVSDTEVNDTTVGENLSPSKANDTKIISKEDEVEDTKDAKAKIKAERKEADADRNLAFEKMKRELSDEPTSFRSKKRKTKEEEIIFSKLDHEMEMERRRLELDSDKQKASLELENFKLELEKSRLRLDEYREERLKEESKRQHELAMAQVNFQNTVCELVSVVTTTLKK